MIFLNHLKMYPDYLEFQRDFMRSEYEDRMYIDVLHARNELNSILSNHGPIHLDNFMDIRDLNSPWLVVFFRREFDVLGHMLMVEAMTSHKFSFGPYTPLDFRSAVNMIPKIGYVSIKTKDDCLELIQHSPLFKKVWEDMEHCDPDLNWILILDSLPGDLGEYSISKNAENWNRFANSTQKLFIN